MQARLFTRTIIFALAVVAYAALPAMQASAQYIHPLVQECRDAMDNSTAKEHCPGLNAHAVTESSDGPGNTCWYYGKCSLTVQVQGSDNSFSVSVSYDSAVYINPPDLRLLDVCFVKIPDAGQGKPGWGIKMKAGCADDDTDADTAKANGLPAATGSN